MSQFLILPYTAADAFADLSPAEIQAIVAKYMAWTDRLRATGRVVANGKLRYDGKALRGAGAAMTVTDGPYAETREIIGGFWLVDAEDYDEVVGWCRDCPHLELGRTLVIRAIEG